MTIEALHGEALDPRVGSVIGARYRIDRLIGRGGMSVVYAATDTALGRTVALKVFGGHQASRGDFDRQRAEIGVLAGLTHPGLVTLFDAFEGDHGEGVLVLEHVDGPDLRARLRTGPLDPEAIRLLGRSIADALAYVHGHGIVHRDVTPANILLPGERSHGSLPVAKLTDFGIARFVESTRQTSEGSVLGTAAYLSPEQALGEAVGPASDVYSLGLVLLECHTGARAFPGTGIEALAARLHRAPELPADMPAAWRDLIMACVARDAADRPSADELVRGLRRLGRARAAAAPAPGTTGATMAVTALDAPTEALRASEQPASAPPLLPPPFATSTSPATAPHGRDGLTLEHALAVDPVVATAESRRMRLRGAPDRDYPGSPASGRRAIITFALIGLLVAGLAVAAPLLTTAPPAEPVVVEPAYPSVEGGLGQHLELLQRLVSQ